MQYFITNLTIFTCNLIIYQEPVCVQGYNTIIKQPMDLETIKKHIDNNVNIHTISHLSSNVEHKLIMIIICHILLKEIQTAPQFLRAVLLMFANAMIYNPKETPVYESAQVLKGMIKRELVLLISEQKLRKRK